MSNGSSLDQGEEGSHYFSHHNTSMSNLAMVHNATLSVYSTCNNFTQSNKIVVQSSDTDLSIATSKPVAVSGMNNFRITNSRRSSLISNYQSAGQKWAGGCYELEDDRFARSANEVLNFLSLFGEDYTYSSVNCHRTSISAIIILLDRILWFVL